MRIATILVAAAAAIGSTMVSATPAAAFPLQNETSYGASSGMVQQAAYSGGVSYSVTRTYHRPYYPRRYRYSARRIYYTPGYATRVTTRVISGPHGRIYRRTVLRSPYHPSYGYYAQRVYRPFGYNYGRTVYRRYQPYGYYAQRAYRPHGYTTRVTSRVTYGPRSRVYTRTVYRNGYRASYGSRQVHRRTYLPQYGY
jgi:hypothetical protein